MSFKSPVGGFSTPGQGAATGATLGAWLGPIGLGVGALGGGLYGAYNNKWNQALAPSAPWTTGPAQLSNSLLASLGIGLPSLSTQFMAPGTSGVANYTDPFSGLTTPIGNYGNGGGTASSASAPTGGSYAGPGSFADTGRFFAGVSGMGLNNEGFSANPIDKVMINGRGTLLHPFSPEQDFPLMDRIFGSTSAPASTTPSVVAPNPSTFASNFQNPFYQPPQGGNPFQYF